MVGIPRSSFVDFTNQMTSGLSRLGNVGYQYHVDKREDANPSASENFPKSLCKQYFYKPPWHQNNHEEEPRRDFGKLS